MYISYWVKFDVNDLKFSSFFCIELTQEVLIRLACTLTLSDLHHLCSFTAWIDLYYIIMYVSFKLLYIVCHITYTRLQQAGFDDVAISAVFHRERVN